MSDIVERAQAHLAYYKSSYAVERGHVTDEPELFSGLLAEIERLQAEPRRFARWLGAEIQAGATVNRHVLPIDFLPKYEHEISSRALDG